MKQTRSLEGCLMMILVLGFFAGILYKNFLAGDSQMQLFESNKLDDYWGLKVDRGLSLWNVFKTRFTPAVVLGAFGCTRWRRVASIFFVLWMGFLHGIILVAAITELGILGGPIFLMGMLPHYLFYGLAYCMITIWMFSATVHKWNSTKWVFTIGMLFLGIVSEVYINPIFMKNIVNWIK